MVLASAEWRRYGIAQTLHVVQLATCSGLGGSASAASSTVAMTMPMVLLISVTCPLIMPVSGGAQPLQAVLRGITNGPGDPSVDVWRTTALPLLRTVSGAEGAFSLKISKRGAPPQVSNRIHDVHGMLNDHRRGTHTHIHKCMYVFIYELTESAQFNINKCCTRM